MLVLAIFSLMTAVALPNVNISYIMLIRVASIVLLYAAALSYNALDIQAIGSGVSIYSGLFQVTSVSQSIDIFIFLAGAIILLPWAPVTKNIIRSAKGKEVFTALPTIAEYPLIILFTLCGSTFLMSSVDLVSIYLSIELQSFAVYVLARLYRNSESATSAGLKYFLLGGLSSGLILLGSALIYAYTGLTNLESIFSLFSVNTRNSVTSLTSDLISHSNSNSFWGGGAIGLTILVVGFLFKVSAAPFHNWAPDVYDGVPTIVTTWLAVMPKISIFVFILELQSGLGLSGASLSFLIGSSSERELYNVWKNLLLGRSLLSLIIGTVVGLAQFRIKRLLAYSTISHVGFLLLALAINSEESIESFLFYLVQYSVTNLNAFLILLAFGYMINTQSINHGDLKKGGPGKNLDIQYISDLAGQFRVNPVIGLALTVSLLSMAGIPPLVGFFGKQQVLYAAVHNGYYFMAIVAIVVSVISASYYLKIIRVIHFDAGTTVSANNTTSITNVHAFAIAVISLSVTLFILKTSIILNSTNILALMLFQL